MKLALVIALIATASCSLYTDDSVLTDRPDAEPIVPNDAAFGPCGAPPDCRPTSGNRVSLCGTIVDTETGLPIVGEAWTGAVCDPDAPTADGPCSLRVRFMDMLGFAANPEGTAPQPADAIEILDCGEFRGIGIERPFSGQIAIVIDSAPGAPSGRVVTGLAFEGDMGERHTGIRAYSTEQTSVDAWTATAGAPFGAQTFAERGAYLPIFRYAGQPVAGVRITRGGSVVASDDYYFDDADASRTSVDRAQTATGPNGSGLIVDSSLGTHSGTGAEPPGCEWLSGLAATTPGALLVSDADAHVIGDPDTPCP